MSAADMKARVVWDEAAHAFRISDQALARVALSDQHLDAVVSQTDETRPIAYPPSPLEFLTSWFSRSPRKQHLAIKRKLIRPYAEVRMNELADSMDALAMEYAANLGDECDVVKDMLRPFSLRAAAQMIGVKENGDQAFAKVVMALSAVLGCAELDPQALHVVATCMKYLRGLVGALLNVERPLPLVTALQELTRPTEDEASIWLAVATLAQILTAGFHPTVTGAALAWRALCTSRSLATRVHNDRTALTSVVDEVLRLEPPFPYLHRWVHEPCECLGIRFEPGRHVIINVCEVNRDPEVFSNPDEIVLGRDPSLSLSFGHGSHRCLGPALARLQVTSALHALLALTPPPIPINIRPQSDFSAHLVITTSLPCRRSLTA